MKSSPGGRAVCGVLSCEVNIGLDNGTLSGTDQIDSNQFSKISSMAVFKRNENDLPTTAGKLGMKVAEITSSQPSLTRVANGIKADGLLEAEKATLQLEMVKQDDCLAQFVCQVRGLGSQGETFVSRSYLVQQAGEALKDHEDNIGWTPVTTMQFISLVHQVNSKMTQILDSKDRWEDKIARYEQNADSLQKDINDQIHSLENRLEDKMYLLEKSIINAIDNFVKDGKRSNSPFYLDSDLADVRSDMLLFKEDIKSNLDTQLINLQRNLSSASVNEQLSRHHFFNEVDTNLSNLSNQLILAMDTGLAGIETKYQELSSAIKTNASEINEIAQKTANVTEDLEKAIIGILTPTTCSKGMVPVLPSPSLPYIVIQPSDKNNLETAILCETYTDGGGWIVIQRHMSGNVDFYRNWFEYKYGFGSLNDSFWLGNEHIHSISKNGIYELRIDMRDGGKSLFAHYGTFYLAGEEDNYAIHLGPYDGTAGDSLQYHTGKAFSTYDKDNDISKYNCAEAHTGAWWYHNCHDSNLNGDWMADGTKGLWWGTLPGSVSYSEMKIRLVA